MEAPWTELQSDALRELANIGCGRATSALSRLLDGRRIVNELPRSRVMAEGALTDLLGTGSDRLWLAQLSLGGTLSGELLCAVPSLAAGELLGNLLDESKGPSGGSSTALSALSEAANIIGSAYLDGVAALTGLSVLPSPPRIERERAAELDAAWQRSRSPVDKDTLAVATWFSAEPLECRPALRGCLLLIPSVRSTAALLTALRIS